MDWSGIKFELGSRLLPVGYKTTLLLNAAFEQKTEMINGHLLLAAHGLLFAVQK